MAKLKNIKAVKEMLGGEHKTQTKKTISFSDKVFVKREVGETWIDNKNQKWEQRNGYKVKVGKTTVPVCPPKHNNEKRDNLSKLVKDFIEQPKYKFE